jgi:hypothetical protein
MQYDYRSTPYFELYEPKLAPFFERVWQRLGPCACASTALLADLAGIDTPLVRASTLAGAPRTLPAIVQALGVKRATLLVPPEAAEYDAALLEGSTLLEGIDCDVRVLAFDAPRYHQHFEGFEAGLSFADLLFSYGPEARALLAEGTRVRTLGVG